MNLQHLSNDELLRNTKDAATREREATLHLLHHLREVERRMAYALKYSSLHAYCVGELGYDGAMAQSRISSMRLLREFPELEPETKSGALNLTLMAQAQSFFKKEKVKSIDIKREILRSISGKSVREATRELLSRAEVPEVHVPEKIREVSDSFTELKFLVDAEIMGYIDMLKSQLGEGSLKEIFRVALREATQKRDPKVRYQAKACDRVADPERAPKICAGQEQVQCQASTAAGKAQNDSREIMGEIKISPPAHEVKSLARIAREVFCRDQYQCTFLTSDNKRCGEKYRLELDHIIPKAKNGPFLVENLRVRCRTHNQWAAVQSFGYLKMEKFLPKLRNSHGPD